MNESIPLSRYRITDHARIEMHRRQITEADIAKTISKPEQIKEVGKGRVIYQSRIEVGEIPKTYLLRVIVDIEREPPNVVTVYRTSKVEKYWIE